MTRVLSCSTSQSVADSPKLLFLEFVVYFVRDRYTNSYLCQTRQFRPVHRANDIFFYRKSQPVQVLTVIVFHCIRVGRSGRTEVDVTESHESSQPMEGQPSMLPSDQSTGCSLQAHDVTRENPVLSENPASSIKAVKTRRNRSKDTNADCF